MDNICEKYNNATEAINEFYNRVYKGEDMNKELSYSKYHYYTHTDFDRLMEENKDSKGFIVIGKNNALMAIKNYDNLKTMLIEEYKGSFGYICEYDNIVRPFIMRIISKDDISNAIQFIKNHKPKQQKIKKQVLVFE